MINRPRQNSRTVWLTFVARPWVGSPPRLEKPLEASSARNKGPRPRSAVKRHGGGAQRDGDVAKCPLEHRSQARSRRTARRATWGTLHSFPSAPINNVALQY